MDPPAPREAGIYRPQKGVQSSFEMRCDASEVSLAEHSVRLSESGCVRTAGEIAIGDRFDSGEQAQQELFDYLDVFYNRRRPVLDD
jgi:hypothetical protein